MKLATMQDEKNLVPYNQSAPQAQMMPQEQGMGQQFMDMAKQKAMSSVIDKGLTTAMGTGAGSAGMAGMATAMPYVGMGLMGAKMLGLFEHGGLVGPLSPQYNAEGTTETAKEGTKVEDEDVFKFYKNLIKRLENKKDKDTPEYKSEGTKPDYLDLDGDGNKTEPMKQAAKEKKPQYNAEGTTEMVQEAIPMPMMMMPMPMQPVPQMQTMPAQPMSPVMSEIDKMRAEYLKSLGV